VTEPTDPIRENEALWDAWTDIHEGSAFYDLEGFREGGIRLRDEEVAAVGDVRGKTLLHLQCHFGIDTLSWARLGATVTGADFSQRAVELAQRLAGDIGVADARFIRSDLYELPRLLDGEIVVTGYQLAMVYAEKLVTALQRGVANTRWRDFADVYLLSDRHDVDGDELAAAVRRVAEFREVALEPLSQALDGYATLAQQRWAAWRRKHRLDDRLPQDFDEVLQRVCVLADPALTEHSMGQTWIATASSWTTL